MGENIEIILVIRTIRLSKLTSEVILYLITKKEIEQIIHPTIESHPSHELMKKYFKYNPGCIRFYLPTCINKLNEAKKIISQNKYLPFETSFGSHKSKIDSYPVFVKSSNGDRGIWIRLAIGSESNLETIIKGIEELITAVNTNKWTNKKK